MTLCQVVYNISPTQPSFFSLLLFTFATHTFIFMYIDALYVV